MEDSIRHEITMGLKSVWLKAYLLGSGDMMWELSGLTYLLLKVSMPAVSLTFVIAVGSPAPDYRMLLDSNPPIFVPLSLNPSAHNKDSHTRSSSSIDQETDPKPATYGARLVGRTAQEELELIASWLRS